MKYEEGEPVLIKSGWVAIPGVVAGFDGEEIVVAIAPEGNLTESRRGYSEWDQRIVHPRLLKRYIW
jgi:hypothetical protein